MNLTNPTAKDIEAIKLLLQPVISLNVPARNLEYGSEEVDELGAFIEDPGPGPEELCLQNERKERLEKYLQDFLPPKYLQIIRMRYGLDDGHYKTLTKIGEELNLSRERVRQIERNALRRLRGKFMAHKITEEDL